MERQQNHYRNLEQYAKDLHEKNRKRIRVSGIVLLALPFVLGLIRWMTDSDKMVFLIIWVICMFVLSAYLVSIEYMDHVIQNKLGGVGDGEEEYDPLINGEQHIPAGIAQWTEGESAQRLEGESAQWTQNQPVDGEKGGDR